MSKKENFLYNNSQKNLWKKQSTFFASKFLSLKFLKRNKIKVRFLNEKYNSLFHVLAWISSLLENKNLWSFKTINSRKVWFYANLILNQKPRKILVLNLFSLFSYHNFWGALFWSLKITSIFSQKAHLLHLTSIYNKFLFHELISVFRTKNKFFIFFLKPHFRLSLNSNIQN